jgi:hypothetical protein
VTTAQSGQQLDPVACKRTTRDQWDGAAAARAEVGGALRQFDGADGFAAPGRLLVRAGTR